MSSNLAAQLREGTTKSHSMAENVSFVKSFLGGVVSKESYRKLIANLYFVYDEIEKQMIENLNHPIIQPIYFEELNRKKSLEQDLLFYYGPEWITIVHPSEATKIYVQRIQDIGLNQPELLIAHAYTRYMGDLSGGQILKKIAKNAMNLNDNQGTAFYDFNDIKDENLFKDNYRKVLDKLPLTEQEIASIIAEANIAFNLNMKMFQELDSNIIKIMLMLLVNAINGLRYKKNHL